MHQKTMHVIIKTQNKTFLPMKACNKKEIQPTDGVKITAK